MPLPFSSRLAAIILLSGCGEKAKVELHASQHPTARIYLVATTPHLKRPSDPGCTYTTRPLMRGSDEAILPILAKTLAKCC
jgi:hypothetical protein